MVLLEGVDRVRIHLHGEKGVGIYWHLKCYSFVLFHLRGVLADVLLESGCSRPSMRILDIRITSPYEHSIAKAPLVPEHEGLRLKNAEVPSNTLISWVSILSFRRNGRDLIVY